MLLSLMLYLTKIGFYSDDWIYLGYYKVAADQSLGNLYNTLAGSPNIRSRPVQAMLQALLYWLFGLQPLGHHLVNASIILVGVLLFYQVLRRLQIERMVALSIPLVFLLLPHYSTDRLWYSSFMVSLSMTLYFISLFADLQVLETKGVKMWLWKILSILGLVSSALSYEIFIPFFFITPILVWWKAQQLNGSMAGQPLANRKWPLLFSLNLLAIILVVVFKLNTSSRMGLPGGMLMQVLWFGKLMAKATFVSYGEYGLALPAIVLSLVFNYPNIPVLVVGCLVGLFVFGYLYLATDKVEKYKESKPLFFYLLCFGLIVFGAGYAIFLTNRNALITPAGINNRIALASAVGIAISFVGIIGWLSTYLSSAKLFRTVYNLLIALLCTCSFIVSNTIASFWVESTRQQQQIIADIRDQFHTLPNGTTLVLDGICPYTGPAVVFESSWDLSGALMIIYNTWDIYADVVTPNMKIENDGLATLMYGGANYTHHPYNDKLFIYHIGRKSVHYLPDAKAAQTYFQQYNPDFSNDCPEGKEGAGVDIF
jgi:hypothetical protein